MMVQVMLMTLVMQDSPPGSLWSEPAARALIGLDGNARRLGDLITVMIREDTSSQLSANTATDRQSDVGGGISGLFGLDSRLNDVGGLGVVANSTSGFTGNGQTSAAGSLSGQLTCQVMDVLPNGNLIIEGRKEVRSNREVQRLMLRGTVRPRDIRMDNTVDSHLIADAQIEYTGQGVVSDKQGPGAGQRILDRVWPF